MRDRLKKGYTPDEIVKLAPAQIKARKHFVHGQSLFKYCQEHGINYSKVIQRYLYRNVQMSLEEIVDNIDKPHPRRETATALCKKYGLHPGNVWHAWDSRGQPGKYVDFVKEYAERSLKRREATTIHDMPLKPYCESKGYSYHRLYSRYRRSLKRFKSFREFVIQWEKDNGYSGETS